MRTIMIPLLLFLAAGLLFWLIRQGLILRRQYRELSSAKAEAEQAGNAKNRFLANISQEILTPINTIMGLDQMILREDTKDVSKAYSVAMAGYARDIRKASESLMILVEDLLELSRIESEGLALSEREYDMQELLQPLVTTVRERSAGKGLNFKVQTEEMLPKRLYGDVAKIRQILLSLLINSVKYTDMGEIVLDLSMDERTDMECGLRIKISDTGMGLEKENLEYIRSLLSGLEEGKAAPVFGTAASLGISARYAAILSGKLSCESVYGEGTEFTFTLKQKIVDATPLGKAEEAGEEESSGSFAPAFFAPDCDVLVADNDPMNLNVVRELLKPTGVFVTTATTGEECLEKIRNRKYDIVLLGHLTAGMDGWETVRRIRETDGELPVYAFTTNANETEDHYRERGFTGRLSNPVDVRELETIIMRHIPEGMMEKHKGA